MKKTTIEKLIYLNEMIRMGLRDNDYDCVRSHYEEFNDVFCEMPEQF